MAQKPLPVPVATTTPAPRRSGWSRRRNLTSSLAVAASLVLVVGLAWQLRPTPPSVPELNTASAEHAVVPAAPPPVEPAADAVSTAMPAAVPVEATAANDKASAAKSTSSPEGTKARTARAAEPQVRAPPQVAPAPPPAYDTTQIVTPPSPPAPPAPVPAPSMAAQSEQASDLSTSPAEQTARMAAPLPAAAPASAPRLSRAAPQSAENAQAERLQQWQSDIEHDAALSRRQWLKRIRERRDAGDLSGARLSLQRFIQDYPEAHIPRDLRPLLKD